MRAEAAEPDPDADAKERERDGQALDQWQLVATAVRPNDERHDQRRAEPQRDEPANVRRVQRPGLPAHRITPQREAVGGQAHGLAGIEQRAPEPVHEDEHEERREDRRRKDAEHRQPGAAEGTAAPRADAAEELAHHPADDGAGDEDHQRDGQRFADEVEDRLAVERRPEVEAGEPCDEVGVPLHEGAIQAGGLHRGVERRSATLEELGRPRVGHPDLHEEEDRGEEDDQGDQRPDQPPAQEGDEPWRTERPARFPHLVHVHLARAACRTDSHHPTSVVHRRIPASIPDLPHSYNPRRWVIGSDRSRSWPWRSSARLS